MATIQNISAIQGAHLAALIAMNEAQAKFLALFDAPAADGQLVEDCIEAYGRAGQYVAIATKLMAENIH